MSGGKGAQDTVLVEPGVVQGSQEDQTDLRICKPCLLGNSRRVNRLSVFYIQAAAALGQGKVRFSHKGDTEGIGGTTADQGFGGSGQCFGFVVGKT